MSKNKKPVKKSLKSLYFETTQKSLKKRLDPVIFNKAWAKAKREAKWLAQGDMEAYAQMLHKKKPDISQYYKECEADPTGKKMTMNRETEFNYRSNKGKGW